MPRIFVSLGSNQGDRMGYLRQAHTLLAAHLQNIHASIVLETKALLPENAPARWNVPYLNQVLSADTSLSPEALLVTLKHIEHTLGRPTQYERWAPRIIDLDILMYDSLTLNTPALAIPHPQLPNRAFLLHLLALLAPQLPYPADNHPYANLPFGEIAHRFVPREGLFENAFVLSPQFVGIINITPDSHSDAGLCFKTEDAVAHAFRLHQQGASILELGAQSTRVGAEFISTEEEWARLDPVLHALSIASTAERPLHLSIDTLNDDIALKALAYPAVQWINNVRGLFKPDTLRQIAASGRAYVAMHALTIPHDAAQVIDFSTPPINTLLHWGADTTQSLLSHGFSLDKIILDPGIGFSKSGYQSLSLIKEISTLKQLGTRLLVGHARKNFMTTFCTKPRADRDIETLALSQKLAEGGIDYLRIYDVTGHHRFFSAQAALAALLT